MAYIKIASLHNPAEWIIQQIKENCNNADDLSKIFLAVEKMLKSATVEKQNSPTLEQLKQSVKTE
jgi:hypothetical protein